jgi:sarcosine oxidase subunit beta
MWREHDLAPTYDVVVIGGGGHGLATAYYLARLGVRNVAVLEARFIGYGGSGRNTAILRSNYRTEEGVRFFDESLRLYEDLAGELDFNLMFSQRGHFTLGHSDTTMATLRTRAEVNKALGVESEVVGPAEIQAMVPDIDVSERPHLPILGALYHPPGGIIRHDAVVWGYARGADRLGVQIHNRTRVERIVAEAGRVTGVVTSRGTVSCRTVVTAVAGWTSEVCGTVGLELPLVTYPLQALVTESYKPWLDPVIVSSNLHVYLSQTDRGELVCGAEIDPYPHYGMRSTLEFLESYAAHVLELFPILHDVKVQRQWAGLADMTADYSPIISPVDEIEGLYVNCGWGTWGFKATPASGLNTAKMVASGSVPEPVRPFGLARFAENRLVGEKAAASVSS